MTGVEPTPHEILVAKYTERCGHQKAINALHFQPETQRIIRALIRALAEREHKGFPQYKGHWDGWALCRIGRRVKTKLGVAFEPGDLAICHRSEFRFPDAPWTVTAYSIRNAVNTSVDNSAVEIFG